MIMAVWTFQIAFGAYILVDASLNEEFEFKEVPDTKIGLSRFICGVIMHIYCTNEIFNGMRIMKYALNHHWKFSNYRLAFLPGFLQFTSMILITVLNYFVIMISGSVLDIAKDFTALTIIGDFDDYFGRLEGGRELAKSVIKDKEY